MTQQVNGVTNLIVRCTLGGAVPASNGAGVGTRPLASTLPEGTIVVATDEAYVAIAAVHPYDATKRIWRPMSGASTNRWQQMVASAAGCTSFRLGVLAGGVFTQATVAGQWCNAVSLQTKTSGQAVGIATALDNFSVSAGVGGTSIGGQFMTSATGTPIPYVAGDGVVPLGLMLDTQLAGSFALYSWYSW